MENTENAYSPSDIEKMLKINKNTLRKYAGALEKAGHSFMRTTGGHRQYRDKDVLLLQHFTALLPQPGMTLEMAATIVFNKHHAAATEQPSNSVTVSELRSDSTQMDQYDERFAQLMAKLDLLDKLPALILNLEEAENNALRLTKEIQALPSPEEIRAQRVDERLAERKIERQLEREALEAWANQPESVRMRKTGLFRKEEDVTARDLFVRDYVDERYDERIREAYGINN